METKINNYLHVSDDATSVKFDKTKTIWNDDPKIENLQNALDTIGEWAKDSGFATEDKFGVVRLAKDSEFTTEKGDGIVNVTKLIKFNERPHATETKHGTSRYATLSEGIAEKSNVKDKIITPYILDQKFNKTTSNYDRFGTVKLANEQMAKVGNDKTRYMTPYLTKLAIDSLVPNVAIATESVSGTVKLATLNDMRSGTAREGVGVSPYAFNNAIATYKDNGTVKIADVKSAREENSDNRVISSKTYKEAFATEKYFGTVKLSKTYNETSGVALASNANVVFKSGGDMTGRLSYKGSPYITESDNMTFPVGAIAIFPCDPPNGFIIADGRMLNKNTYPKLFSMYGYRYGGSGDNFGTPDMRGLFVRGVGKSRHINGNLSDGVSGSSLGQIQRQQVRKHKHVGSWGVDDGGGYFGTSWGGYKGSGRHDYNNPLYWTNDGMPWNGNPNPDGIIGMETRPWNISMYYCVKVG